MKTLPQLPGAASFKRVLDGALSIDARARRVPTEGCAALLWEAASGQPLVSKEVHGAPERGSLGVVGRGELKHACASWRSAPRAYTIQTISNERTLVEGERAA